MLVRERELSTIAVEPPPRSQHVAQPVDAPPPPHIGWDGRRRTSRAFWFWVGLGLCFIPLGIVLRSCAVNRALRLGQHTLHGVVSLLPRASSQAKPEDDYFPFFRFVDEGSKQTGSESSLSDPKASGATPLLQSKKKVANDVAPPLGPPPASTRAAAALVLYWANNKIIPRGRSRGAEYGLPPGIELSQTSGLGIGVLDGDRLVSVNGISVEQRAQVVAEVLAARGRGETAILARLIRRTKAGPKEFTVAVEQPYLAPTP